MESREQSPASRRVRIDIAELVDAFDSGSQDVAMYLDVEGAEVVWVTSEVQFELERLRGEMREDLVDEDARAAAIAAAVAEHGASDWMVEPLQEADRIEAGFRTRFIPIPWSEPRERYGDMREFIQTVPNEGRRERLWNAIRGRGAFRRFNDVLASDESERQRWLVFRDERVRERVLEWLADEGIELATEPE